MTRRLAHTIYAFDHALTTHAVIDATVHILTETLTLAHIALRNDRLANRAGKSCISVIPRVVPTPGTRIIHHAVLRPSLLSGISLR